MQEVAALPGASSPRAGGRSLARTGAIWPPATARNWVRMTLPVTTLRLSRLPTASDE